MKNYKRSPIDREVTFKAPFYECHACNDSGIIHNSDGLINQHLPDYDIDDSGKRCGGQDLALICWCSAANATYDQDNQLVCKGYRELDNTIRNNVGVNLDIDIVREIHNIRKENWIKTTKLMNKTIADNLKKKKTKLPPEVQKVKEQLANFTIKSL